MIPYPAKNNELLHRSGVSVQFIQIATHSHHYTFPNSFNTCLKFAAEAAAPLSSPSSFANLPFTLERIHMPFTRLHYVDHRPGNAAECSRLPGTRNTRESMPIFRMQRFRGTKTLAREISCTLCNRIYTTFCHRVKPLFFRESTASRFFGFWGSWEKYRVLLRLTVSGFVETSLRNHCETFIAQFITELCGNPFKYFWDWIFLLLSCWRVYCSLEIVFRRN